MKSALVIKIWAILWPNFLNTLSYKDIRLTWPTAAVAWRVLKSFGLVLIFNFWQPNPTAPLVTKINLFPFERKLVKDLERFSITFSVDVSSVPLKILVPIFKI